jgi:hypothetical protein
MRMRKMATIARPMTKNAIVGRPLGSWGSQIDFGIARAVMHKPI